MQDDSTDLSPLTAEERTRYKALRRPLTPKDYGRRTRRSYWIGAVIGGVGGVGAFFVLLIVAPPGDDTSMMKMLGGVLAGTGLWVWGYIAAFRTARDRDAAEYLTEIGYEARLVEKQAQDAAEKLRLEAEDDDDDDDRGPDGRYTWSTGIYDPVRYRQQASGFDRSHRQYVRDHYGSFDLYEENHPD